jgi:hypothetical protein
MPFPTFVVAQSLSRISVAGEGGPRLELGPATGRVAGPRRAHRRCAIWRGSPQPLNQMPGHGSARVTDGGHGGVVEARCGHTGATTARPSRYLKLTASLVHSTLPLDTSKVGVLPAAGGWAEMRTRG